MQESDIIALYFERDERAIAETAEQYGKLCHRIAQNIVGDEHDAEECVNDTYLGVWNAIPPERPQSLLAFVARIARNISLSRLRHRTAARRNAETLLSLSELEEIVPGVSGFEEIEDREIGAWISDFLRGEKEEVRLLFVRKYWYFDSVSDLARQFGHSEAKIKSILFRTRNKLRVYLGERGISV